MTQAELTFFSRMPALLNEIAEELAKANKLKALELHMQKFGMTAEATDEAIDKIMDGKA